MFRMTECIIIMLPVYVMLSKVEELKHLLAGNALSTVIPREHSDRGNPLAGYALSTRVVAGRLRGDSSLKFRMTCPHYPNFSSEWVRLGLSQKKIPSG